MKQCEIEKCIIQPVATHEIFTRGAHGKAALIPENQIDLCWIHHSGCHQIGRDSFAKKHGLEERFKRAEEALSAN